MSQGRPTINTKEIDTLHNMFMAALYSVSENKLSDNPIVLSSAAVADCTLAVMPPAFQ